MLECRVWSRSLRSILHNEWILRVVIKAVFLIRGDFLLANGISNLFAIAVALFQVSHVEGPIDYQLNGCCCCAMQANSDEKHSLKGPLRQLLKPLNVPFLRERKTHLKWSSRKVGSDALHFLTLVPKVICPECFLNPNVFSLVSPESRSVMFCWGQHFYCIPFQFGIFHVGGLLYVRIYW